MIKKIMKSEVEFIVNDERLRPATSEVFRLWGDNKLLKEKTGFVPKYSLMEGLQKTVNWYTDPENLKKYKVDIYNV